MAFVTLEDMTGQIECLVFPRVYEKYQTYLQEDAAVAVSGKISVREEEAPKLLADRITPLEDWKPAQTGAPAGAQAQPRRGGAPTADSGAANSAAFANTSAQSHPSGANSAAPATAGSARSGAAAGASAQTEPRLTDAQFAKDAAHKLFLRLNRADMNRITALLALEAGDDIPVYMHIPAEKITLLCPRTAWCSGSEACLRRLQEALGEGNVVLK